MRKLSCSKLFVMAIVGSFAFSLFITSADARRAYDSSGASSTSQSTSAVNQYAPPNAYAPQQSQSSSSQSNQYTPPSTYAPQQNQYTPPSTNAPQQNQYTPPSTYAPQQNQYTQAQNQHAPWQNRNQYNAPGRSYPNPQQTRDNGTNFYGVSPEQLSGGAAVRQNTFRQNGGNGGYDPRWNPNFGTNAGAQTMARESGSLIQALRSNFPLPVSSDESQMFQVNEFAARSNGGMQSRPR